MTEAIQHILATAHRHGIKACLHCGTPDYAARAVSWGFDLVTVGGDSRFLAAAANASVSRFRDLVGQESKTVVLAAKGGY